MLGEQYILSESHKGSDLYIDIPYTFCFYAFYICTHMRQRVCIFNLTMFNLRLLSIESGIMEDFWVKDCNLNNQNII